MALTDNLVAYYKLDGNSNDSVGGYNGSDTSVSYSSSYGKINQGASFNGSSSQINLPSGMQSIFSGTNSYTVSVLAKFASTGQSGQVLLFTQNTSSSWTYNSLDFFLGLGGDGKIKFARGDGISYPTLSSTNGFTAGTWGHAVITYDGSTMKCYINGTFDSSLSSSISATTASSGRFIGVYKSEGVQVRWFPGYMDELGIWSRALSADEISQLYNSGAGLQYPFTTNKPSLFPFFSNYI